jgi:hypothetical protein
MLSQRGLSLLFTLVGLAACTPAPQADASVEDVAPRMDATVTPMREASVTDTFVEPLDVRENDDATSGMLSRGCSSGSPTGWSVQTSVVATTPDGRCPDRVRVVARGSNPSTCGDIEPCCDFFAQCLFDVEFDTLHESDGGVCARPNRVENLRCRCVGNRVVCDPARRICPDSLPAGYECAPRPGEAFPRAFCSECGADAGVSG